MLTRVVEEEGLEVGAAGREDHLVRLDRVSVTSQGDVYEGLALQELVEHVGQVALVVVPSETELLRRAGASPWRVVVHVVAATQTRGIQSVSTLHGTRYATRTRLSLTLEWRGARGRTTRLPST